MVGNKSGGSTKAYSPALSGWQMDDNIRNKFLQWEKGEVPEGEEVEGEVKEEAEKEAERQRLKSLQQAERQRAAMRLKEKMERVRAYKERKKMRERRKKSRKMVGAVGKMASLFGSSSKPSLSGTQRARIKKHEGGGLRV